MKITHNKIGQNLNLTDSSKADKAKQNSSVAGVKGDTKASQANDIKDLSGKNDSDAVKIDLSTRAQDVRQAKELAMASPDVNMDKVEKFRKLIDEGKYKVDAKSVADRMVDEHLKLSGLGASNND